jgi:hypothetical protein
LCIEAEEGTAIGVERMDDFFGIEVDGMFWERTGRREVKECNLLEVGRAEIDE